MARTALALLLPLAAILGACARTGGEMAPPAPAIEPAAGPGLAWPVASSCAGLVESLARLDPALLRELDPHAPPLAVTLLGAASPKLVGGPPLAEHAPDGACQIVVGAAVKLPAPADQLLGREAVHSTYPSGTKRRRNVEHQAIEQKLAAARREADRQVDVLATGDPLLDLIGTVAGGIIGGIGAIAGRQDIQSLESALAASPAYIEEPILAPYRYELIDLEAERRFSVPVTLHDGQASWRRAISLSERRRFALADGRHPGDTQARHAPEAALIDKAGLAAWRESPPPLDKAALVTHLAAAIQETDGRAAMLAEALEEPARLAAIEPAVGPMATAPATAREHGGDLLKVGAGDLPGFYVTAEHIVVPAEALGRSSIVAVAYPDGMRAHGLVELVDDGLGLALVYLPRRGEALPLSHDASSAPAMSGRAGVPWQADGAVVGLFTVDAATTGSRWVDGATLGRLVDRLDTL